MSTDPSGPPLSLRLAGDAGARGASATGVRRPDGDNPGPGCGVPECPGWTTRCCGRGADHRDMGR